MARARVSRRPEAGRSPDRGFRVAGIIELSGGIRVRNSNLTVAGQTAPGGGITLTGSNGNLLFILNDAGVHDVTVRYLRLRHGLLPGQDDNLTIHDGHDIIIDHVSMSWSTDENLGIWRENDRPPIYNITVQRSMMAEGLTGHSNGMHISGEKDYSLVDPIEAWRQIKDSPFITTCSFTTPSQPRVVSAVAGNQQRRLQLEVQDWRDDERLSHEHVNNYYKAGPMSSLQTASQGTSARSILTRKVPLPTHQST
jgi:hypothetical protein